MVGITGPSMQEVLAKRPNEAAKSNVHIPQEIVISPAIFECLKGFGGLAVAITEIRPNGPPEGVAVLHHGDATLLKGVIETAFLGSGRWSRTASSTSRAKRKVNPFSARYRTCSSNRAGGTVRMRLCGLRRSR